MKKIVGVGCVVVMCAMVAVGETRSKDADIVVSATRMASEADLIASSVTVITRDMIEKQQHVTMIDVLRNVRGVHVAGNGGLGATSGVFLRGAKPEQTLVLIDGVEINDPISAGRAPHLANIDLQSIERIEVLRGVQGSLYGSDALGGVISITTRRGSGDPKYEMTFEGGSFNTFRESIGVSGSSGIVDYSAWLSRIDSEGISSANEDDGNTEPDGFMHSSVSTRIGLEPSDVLRFELSLMYFDSESDFDAFGGPGGDADANVATRKSLFVRGQAEISLLDSMWNQTIGVSFARHDRSSDSSWGMSTFDSHLVNIGWQNSFNLGDANVLTMGVEFDQETGETDSLANQRVTSTSAYVQDQMEPMDGLAIAAGARVDSHDEYGTEATFRAGPTYSIEATGTRLKATYGTGYKAPSLYQLYAPATQWGSIGNTELDPESSAGWDAGIEQVFREGMVIAGATYFDTDFSDMIDFEAGYINKSKAETTGVECFATVQVLDNLGVGVTYTYLDAKDKADGSQLIRRPTDRASLSVDFAPTKKANISVNVLYVGEAADKSYNASTFTYTDVTLPAYTVVDIAASYQLSEIVRLFGRIENLFDTDYEEADGYGTPGMSGYAGVNITL